MEAGNGERKHLPKFPCDEKKKLGYTQKVNAVSMPPAHSCCALKMVIKFIPCIYTVRAWNWIHFLQSSIKLERVENPWSQGRADRPLTHQTVDQCLMRGKVDSCCHSTGASGVFLRDAFQLCYDIGYFNIDEFWLKCKKNNIGTSFTVLTLEIEQPELSCNIALKKVN